MPLIRPARPGDLGDILDIYAAARRFMKAAGNPTQWGDTDPREELVREDIRLGHSHVVEVEGRIQAVFAMIPGEDPTYRVIEGAWLDDGPYCAVHRVASRGEVPGLTTEIFRWVLARHPSVRIDTHVDNRPMQRALEKNGFVPCGRIQTLSGSPRVAYQKLRTSQGPKAAAASGSSPP